MGYAFARAVLCSNAAPRRAPANIYLPCARIMGKQGGIRIGNKQLWRGMADAWPPHAARHACGTRPAWEQRPRPTRRPSPPRGAASPVTVTVSVKVSVTVSVTVSATVTVTDPARPRARARGVSRWPPARLSPPPAARPPVAPAPPPPPTPPRSVTRRRELPGPSVTRARTLAPHLPLRLGLAPALCRWPP